MKMEKPTSINDIEFLIDRIIMLPKIRPHELERAVIFGYIY